MQPRFLVLVAVLASLVVLPGCGKSLAPVKGRVTWKGQGVKEAAVSFNPVPSSEEDRAPGKPATGFTDDEGNYVLSTFKPYDGALVGQHKVFINLDETNRARCKRSTEITLEVKPGDNQLDIVLE
jgi:hypothetical protein